MRVELRLGGLISIDHRAIPLGKTLALLDAIVVGRSVRGAAERLSLSYRSVWARVVELEQAVGRAVVVKTKGHGTVLTELGQDLRAALQETLDRFEAPLSEEQQALERRLASLIGARPARARLAVSHDPLLIEVLARHPNCEVAVTGTEVALDRLRSGAAEVAGCHFGPEDDGAWPGLLRDGAYVAQLAVLREQGLILAPGNPLGIRSVSDLPRAQARFINRQRGSGTRAWFERLLRASSTSPDAVVGFGQEEFTHHAVAAVVASGAADAGFGVRAVADAFGLAFVPLGWEPYYLIRRAGRRSPALDELAAELRALSRTTTGYLPPPEAAQEPPSTGEPSSTLSGA